MTVKELERIVSKGEGLHIEFKHKINFPEKIARELVAFANTKGGKLFVGIDDNKVIYGLKHVEEEIYALEQLVKNYIKFPLDYSAEKISINQKKDVLAVSIPEAHKKPNFALEKPSDKFGTAYVRTGDKSVKASDEMIKILKLKALASTKPLSFGDLEKKVIEIIEKDGHTTVKSLQDKQLLTLEMASRLLINLTVTGLLNVEPEEGKDDKFVLVSLFEELNKKP